MSEETAKALAEAMNRLAAAIERVSGGGGFGIHLYHHNVPSPPASFPRPNTNPWPPTYGGIGSSEGW